MADPETTWRLVDENTVIPAYVTTLNLRPWDDIALRQWFTDCEFGPQDPEGRSMVEETTGNWPVLLEDFYGRCQGRKARWETVLKEMAEELDTRDVDPWA